MNRTSPLRAVVFDFDGTVVNSLPLVLASIIHALEPFGGRPTMDIFARLGGPPERFLPLLLDDPKHAPEALARMDAYHHANNHLVTVFDGATAMLEALRSAQVKTAVWTGRDRGTTESLLRGLKLDAYFVTTVCGDDLPTHKPDAAGLREIMRRLGVAPAETVFVGDADVDVLGGAGAGVDTILIRHTRDVSVEVTASAWRSVGTPSEAFSVVLECLAQRSVRA